MFTYPYLYDKSFLEELLTQSIRGKEVRIQLLDWYDKPIPNGLIEGWVTGGNININGNSAIRRTGSLTCTIPKEIANITDIDNIISINKRIRIELGSANYTNEYQEYPVLWFPQGIFIITGAQITHSPANITLSINFKDKMVLLNGECGGMFSRTMVHTPIYDCTQSVDGTPIKTPVLFTTLIQTLVSEYSGLRPEQIILDINASTENDDKMDQIISWTGANPIYFWKAGNEYTFSETYPSDVADTVAIETRTYGDAIGYQRIPFSYPVEKELTSNTGESVVSVLDKIKNTLGNVEYYFDIDGNFHFEPITNFQRRGLKTDSNRDAITAALTEGFLVGTALTDEVEAWDFISCHDQLTNLNYSPRYESIKNDLSITGVRGDNKQMVQYHLVFEDLENNPFSPAFRNNSGTWVLYPDLILGEALPRVKYYPSSSYVPAPNEKIFTITDDTDYRTQLYLSYIRQEQEKTLPKERPEWIAWGKELKEWWPYMRKFSVTESKLSGDWNIQASSDLTSLIYYFELLDYSDLNVSAIGHRPKSIHDDKVNVVFSVESPKVYCVIAGQENTAQQRRDALTDGQYFLQVPPHYSNTIAIGLTQKSAYDSLRAMVHTVIQYNESISVGLPPVYFLEPNTLIQIEDPDTGITGYYEIKSFSVPLGNTNSMSLSCVRATTMI